MRGIESVLHAVLRRGGKSFLFSQQIQIAEQLFSRKFSRIGLTGRFGDGFTEKFRFIRFGAVKSKPLRQLLLCGDFYFNGVARLFSAASPFARLKKKSIATIIVAISASVKKI